MSTCHTPPPNRKLLIDQVGKELTVRHGKQKSYTQPQIRSAASDLGYAVDIHCWAYCVFMSQDAFDAFHRSIGEHCDFNEMRATMLSSLNLGFYFPDFSLPSFDLPSFEWPDIDFGSIFDWSK